MDNIYDIFSGLKERVSSIRNNKKRYIVIYLNHIHKNYFFELSDTYIDLVMSNFKYDLLIAYRKSGKIILEINYNRDDSQLAMVE